MSKHPIKRSFRYCARELFFTSILSSSYLVKILFLSISPFKLSQGNRNIQSERGKRRKERYTHKHRPISIPPQDLSSLSSPLVSLCLSVFLLHYYPLRRREKREQSAKLILHTPKVRECEGEGWGHVCSDSLVALKPRPLPSLSH